MKTSSTIKLAFRAIRRNKLRSILTALGIIIGVAAVIATWSIGNGAKAQVEAQIASLGQNVIQISAGSTTASGINTGWGSSASLKVEDAEAIRREIPQVIAISPESSTVAQVAAGNQNWYTQIYGQAPDFFEIRQWPLESGSVFTEQDVRSANKVAVVGRTIANQLFAGDDPVGQVIRIKNVPFVVVGLLTSEGFSFYGRDQDDVVILPHTSASKRISGTRSSIRNINAQVADASQMDFVQQQIVGLLRQRHQITAGKDDDFTVRSQEEIAATSTAATNTMTVLVGSIAAISLVVGGIGIMNIMLVSVTERTREIGIRMAVGAHSNDILMQFLIEAVTLSSLGGIIGIITGIGASQALSAIKDWPTLISLDSILVAFCFSALVGIFFGFYPARKAAALDPIEALRYE
jgi:putative ABC transport system permease protein